jgi:integrase
MGRNGSGIRAVSATSYEISFTYKNVRCRERVNIQPSPANLKRVTRHLGAINDAIERGTFDYGITFPDSKRRLLFVEWKGVALPTSEYLSEWLDSRKPHLKPSTWNDYNKIVHKTLIPVIGKIAVSELKRAHIKDMFKPMNVGNKRLANIQSVLRAALQEAVDDEIIEINLLANWKFVLTDIPAPIDDVDPFTREEQALILDKLEGQARNMFRFAFWSGLRTSELVALDWNDVDWQKNEIYVTRAITQAAKGKPGTPKTLSSKRWVKLLDPALKSLVDQKEHTFLAGKEIFQNPRTLERWAGDQPIRRTCWIYALKAAGVRYRRPYQTRHTYASMMLSSGESPMWVAAQMGHSDWGMIRKTYGKFMPDAIPDAGNKAVEIYGRNAVIKAVITKTT